MVKGKTSLTFYGGVDEVGGNKILLQDKDVKILFDFGMSYNLRRKFYSDPFLSPKSEKSLKKLGILPNIDGLYKFEDSKKQIDAVFISHSHMDHSAYISFLKDSIPIYCGETTKTILEAISQTKPTNLEFNINHLEFKVFRTGDEIKIGHVKVEPVHVDHSVPGAYGFIIHTTNGTIVYTGDFRTHGAKVKMTQDFVERASETDPLVLIHEATNLTNAHLSSEREVERKLIEITRETSGLVIADFARADVDRFRSFYKAAKANGRYLAISMKQAFLIEKLAKDKHLKIPSLRDENLKIFCKEKERYYGWEKKLKEKFTDKIVNSKTIGKRGNKFILTLSFYDFEELFNIKPPSGSCYILSASEPFNEEMEIDFLKLKNWLEHFGMPQYHVHVSGHILPLDLKRTIAEISPKMAFPVHTEHQKLVAKFIEDLKIQTVEVKREHEYVLR